MLCLGISRLLLNAGLVFKLNHEWYSYHLTPGYALALTPINNIDIEIKHNQPDMTRCVSNKTLPTRKQTLNVSS